MKFDIITIFPEIFGNYLNESILKRAQKKKLINVKIHNLRDFTKDKLRRSKEVGAPTRTSGHRKVDDRPFGGGPGMVFKIEPIVKVIGSILKISNFQFPISKQIQNFKFKKTKIILFTPSGKQFDNKTAVDLAKKYDNLILICGRYEGIDERVKKIIKDQGLKIQELSIGPYVLTGGELPAMVLIDAVSRQIPGVLGKTESLEEKRHGIGMPVYTRPEIFIYNPDALRGRGFDRKRRRGKKYRVPKVLLSGNHKKIEAWKKSIR